MNKVIYKRREFLEPYISGAETAYVYAFVETWDTTQHAKKTKRKPHKAYATEFGFHDGNETLHLHFDTAGKGSKTYFVRKDIDKLRKLADVAIELADKLEKL